MMVAARSMRPGGFSCQAAIEDAAMILAFSKSVQSSRELSVVTSGRCGTGSRTSTSSSRSSNFATNLPLTAMLADACWLACCLPPQWA
jgi:hypothetical protein